jgi:hypothetical protein
MLDLGDLGLDEGAHLLIKRALAPGRSVIVSGTAPSLAIDLPAWCRARGHALDKRPDGFAITAGPDRWRHAERAGDPPLRGRLAAAIERRHASLAHTAGLNEEVFDALLLLAAGSWEPAALRRGHAAVVALSREMDDGRRLRLGRLGFSPADAARLSSLHTRNFM